MLEYKKAVAPSIGANGNIFNLMAIAKRTLQANGKDEQAKRMISDVQECKSYNEALIIIGNYVEFGEVGSNE